MRARIRAAVGLLGVLALLPGASARAQEQTPPAQTEASTTAAPAELRLSLDDVVKRALDNNVDIVVERFNPELSEQSVRGALGFFDPYVSATVSHQSSDQPATSAFSGGEVVNTKQDVWNLSAVAPIRPTGGTLELDFTNNKRATNNVFSTFNPSFNSGLNLSLTQPLLRNFKIDSGRNQLRIAKKNREISDVQFRATVVGTVANVKALYYELIYAMDNLAVAQKNLDLAKRLLNENEIRVKVGTMAPLDVVQAQSEMASREESVILAENALAQAEDNVKRAIFPANDPAMWSTRVIPADRPTAEPTQVDLDAAVRNALANRTDIVAARKGLERSDFSLEFARNQMLPSVNLVAGYGANGVGGTQIERGSLGGPIVNTIPGGYGDAISDVFGRDFPTWQVGVNFAYSIPNRGAKASFAQARISKDQALASFRRLEVAVAAEVRTAARAVESGFKRVQSTQAARTLAAQRLDAEEKKFAAGMSTNFLVTQAQRDLAAAEVAGLRAVLDYRQSIINFQRVQEAGVGGSGSTAFVSTGGSSSAARPTGGASSSQQNGSNFF